MGDFRVTGTSMTTAWQYGQCDEQGQPASSAAPEEETEQAVPTLPKEEKQDPAALWTKEDCDRSLVEKMQEAQKKAQEQRDRFKIPKSSMQYGNAAMTAYARLGRARSKAEVSAASGYARRCIAQFQTALRQDSDNAERIRAAIQQLQKAVNRGSQKKRELDREQLIQNRQKRAEQENQRRKAMQLSQELNRRKSARKIREHGYLRETEIENRLQAQLAQTRMELRAQAQALGASTAASLQSAVQQYSAQTTAAAPVPSAEINLEA